MRSSTFLKEKHGFFYLDETTTLESTQRFLPGPGESLDWERFLNGQMLCWKAPQHQITQIKRHKHHIINFPYLGFTSIEVIKSYLREYSKARVYIPTEGNRLIQVTTAEEFVFTHRNITLLTPEKLYELADKYGMPKSQVKIIDYLISNVNKLSLPSDNLSHPKFDDHDLMTLPLSQVRYLDSDSFKQMMASLSTKNKIGLDLTTVRQKTKLTSASPVPAHVDIALQSLNIEGLAVDLNQIDSEITKALRTKQYAKNILKKIKVFVMTNFTRETGLDWLQILLLPTELRELSIEEKPGSIFTNRTYATTRDGAPFTSWTMKIEKLTIGCFRPEFLYELPALTHLTIDAQASVDWTKLSTTSPFLQNVHLVNVTTRETLNFLSSFPHVRHLRITHKQATDEKEYNFSEAKLSNIESLTTDQNSNLFQLLKYCPKLTSLELDSKEYNDNEQEKSLTFPHLRHFKTNNRKVAELIFQRAKNLEYLTAPLYNGEPFNTIDQFPKFEFILFQNSKYEFCIESAIRYYRYQPDGNKTQPLYDLTESGVLHVNNRSGNCSEFERTISNSTSLRRLRIENCTYKENKEASNNHSLQLPVLTEIIIKSSQLPASFLAKIMSASPNLESIDLSDTTFTDNIEKTNLIDARKLKRVFLKDVPESTSLFILSSGQNISELEIKVPKSTEAKQTQINLPKLHSLNIEITDNLTIISPLLRSNSQLRSLTLSISQLLVPRDDHKIDYPDQALPKLTDLHFRSAFATEFICFILSKTCKLRHLSFHAVYKSQTKEILSDKEALNALITVENLSVDNIPIDFLSSFPNLVSYTQTGILEAKHLPSQEVLPTFSNLKQIKMNQVQDISAFGRLLNSAPNLEFLEFEFAPDAKPEDAERILFPIFVLKLQKQLKHVKVGPLSKEYAQIVKNIFPHAEIELGTWPFYDKLKPTHSALPAPAAYQVTHYTQTTDSKLTSEAKITSKVEEQKLKLEQKAPKGEEQKSILELKRETPKFESKAVKKDEVQKEIYSAPAWSNRKRKTLDTNVRDAKSNYQPDLLIFPNKYGYPQPRNYIENTYRAKIQNGQIIKESLTIEPTPIIVPKKDNLYQHYNQERNKSNHYEKNVFFAHVKLELLPNKIVPLPTLPLVEKISFYDTDIDNINLTFFYDHITARHYVMLSEIASEQEVDEPRSIYAITVTVSYLLQTFNIKDKELFPYIEDAENIVRNIKFIEQNNETMLSNPDAIKAGKILRALLTLMRDSDTFKPKDIDLDSGLNFLNAMLLHQTGRCEHQSTLINILATILKYPSLIDDNQIHSSTRFFDGEYWRPVDQGGYPATVIPRPLPTIKEKPKKAESKRQAKDKPKEQLKPLVRQSKTLLNFADFEHDLRIQLEQLPPTKRNVLFYCSNDLALLSIAGEFLQQIGTNAFYIDDLNQMSDKTFSVTDDGIGQPAPSELKQFIDTANQRYQQDKTATGTLIINCSTSTRGLFIVYQALDHTRRLGHIGNLPPGINIICLVEKGYLTDKSFKSRFSILPSNTNEMLDNKIKLAKDFVLNHTLVKKSEDKAEESKAFLTVDLYGGDEWSADLIGQPGHDDKNHFSFQTKPFGKLLESDKPTQSGLHILNASVKPLTELHNQNRDLYLFLLKATACEAVFFNGKTYLFPKKLPIQLTEYKEYNFSNECRYEALTEKNSKDCQYILNPETYSHFLRSYICKSQGLPQKKNGILALYTNTLQRGPGLTIRVTRGLAHGGYWKRFFDHVRQYNVKLRLVLNPDVVIPGVKMIFTQQQTLRKQPQLLTKDTLKSLSQFTIIISNTPLASADEIASELKSTLIYVSKTHTFADLFESLNKSTEENQERLPSLNYQEGELVKKLIAGEALILTGNFSTSLALRLETFAATKPYLRLNGEDKFLSGQIIVIATKASLFPAATNHFVHQAKLEKKRMISAPRETSTIPTLQALDLESKEIKPSTAMIKQSLLQHPKNELEARLKLLSEKIRQDNPCLYLEGPTAAGKSTTIRRFLPEYYKKVYHQTLKIFEGDIQQLKECLSYQKNNPDVLCIWFADEANLKPNGSFDFLEGYYQKSQPGIMIDKVFYPKNTNVRIILAGNPRETDPINEIGYADRQKNDFIDNHPEITIKVKPFSNQYIREEVTKPLLTQLFAEEKIPLDLDKTITLLFDNIKQLSPKTLFTIRNWNQICFRIAMFLKFRRESFKDTDQAVSLALYDEFEILIADNEKSKLQQALFGSTQAYDKLTANIDKSVSQKLAKTLQTLPPKKNGAPKFHLTPSRYHVARLLDDQLRMRELLMEFPQYATEIRRCSLLEGQSAIGKTLMMQAILDANDFTDMTEGVIEGVFFADRNKLYTFVSLFDTDKDEYYFQNGIICLFDEYNAVKSNIQEARYNNYSTGVNQKGEKDLNGGWLLWATQNQSASHENRQKASLAAENRFFKLKVETYLVQEYYELLLAKGIPDSVAQDFMHIKDINQQLTWREIERLADKWIAEHAPSKDELSLDNTRASQDRPVYQPGLQDLTFYQQPLLQAVTITETKETVKHNKSGGCCVVQ